MTTLILLIIAILFAVLWFRARDRADVAEAGMQSAQRRAALAERKADNYRELLEQSYVGLQALAEKNLEAEWIRDGQGIVQPGIWVGDQFMLVEDGEPGDLEVGQPVGEDFDTAASPLRRVGKVETYDWKSEMPRDDGQ